MPPISELPMQPQTFDRIGYCSRFCGRCCSLSHWQAHPQYETVKAILEAPPFIGMNENGDCGHLVWKNGFAVCSIYETRPDICRTFPNHPLSIATIPECSFRFQSQTVETEKPI